MACSALVTGAAGFIGSHVAEHCLGLGMEVTAVDNLSGGCVENIPAGCRRVLGDLSDAGFVEGLFRHVSYDFVYHLAAYAAEGLSHFIRRHNYTTNLGASVNLINASVNHEVACFVFASSIAVYGAGQTPMTEDTVPCPEDPYGISKYAVELDLQSARRLFDLDHIIFRPHNVYGRRQNIFDPYRNVIGIFMNQCHHGLPMSVFGDGSQTRAFTHIDDVAPVIARAPLMPAARNKVFNIGADAPCSVLDVAGYVAEAMGVPRRTVHHPARQEVVHAFSDHRRFHEVFPMDRAPVSLEAGIRDMANWVKSCDSRSATRFENIEIRKNLPPAWARLIEGAAPLHRSE